MSAPAAVETHDEVEYQKPHGRRKEALLGRSPQDTSAGWLNYVLLTIIVVVGAWPIYWAGVIMTAGEDKIYKPGTPEFLPGTWEIAKFNFDVITMRIQPQGYPNYSSSNFERSFMNSILVVAIVVTSTLFFCSLAGFAFAKLRFKGRDPLFYFVVLTLTIPAQLGIVGGYQIMEALGWLGTLLAVTVPALVSAFGVFYMRQFIEDAIPDELIESARVDGATTFRVYASIVVPIIRPAMGVLGLLTAVGAWNEYIWSLVVVGGSEWQTIGPALHNLRAGATPKASIMLTGSFLASVPLILLLVVAGRQIVRGLMEGAVKA
ncbi:MAG: sugar ABC transporter permease [Actinobacteria bacterium HGW-Actinobacteria-4]|nr:MAG: sugar ABC transporter permease [Actinobacteria bacterium HGW-Actinobacteria-4]